MKISKRSVLGKLLENCWRDLKPTPGFTTFYALAVGELCQFWLHFLYTEHPVTTPGWSSSEETTEPPPIPDVCREIKDECVCRSNPYCAVSEAEKRCVTTYLRKQHYFDPRYVKMFKISEVIKMFFS